MIKIGKIRVLVVATPRHPSLLPDILTMAQTHGPGEAMRIRAQAS